MKIIGNAHKVLGRASSEIPYNEAQKFLASCGMWDEMPPEEREHFCRRGEIMDTPAGNKLAQLIGLRGAEETIRQRHFRKNGK